MSILYWNTFIVTQVNLILFMFEWELASKTKATFLQNQNQKVTVPTRSYCSGN